MLGTYELWSTSLTRPTTLPLIQWSVHAMIPRMVFRSLHVPLMILDPQSEHDVFPATDQNERLAKDHPDLVIHRVYAQSGHNIRQSRPDWFVRDAAEQERPDFGEACAAFREAVAAVPAAGARSGACRRGTGRS
jgi:hypothetical protein